MRSTRKTTTTGRRLIKGLIVSVLSGLMLISSISPAGAGTSMMSEGGLKCEKLRASGKVIYGGNPWQIRGGCYYVVMAPNWSKICEGERISGCIARQSGTYRVDVYSVDNWRKTRQDRLTVR